jgi:aryl-alcohol dehydrogenase-like predicted oxidoreductase
LLRSRVDFRVGSTKLPQVQYRKLGKSELNVSIIGLGTMSWPGCNYGESGYAPAPDDLRAARGMVQAALDAGINLFDTAEGYGRGLAEEILGQTLEELGCRERAIIVTKVGPLFGEEQTNGRTCNLSAKHIAERCELSLKRLHTNHIDLYLAHWPDPLTPIQETMEATNKLKEQGKIRWFGVSNFSNDLLDTALRHGVVTANQLPYSLADRTIDADKRPFCLANQVGIMAYSPLGKGVLSGKYDAQHLPPANDYRHHRKYFAKENLPRYLALAERLRELAPRFSCTPVQLALAWVLVQPGITVALPGAKSPDQIRANAGASGVSLTDDVVAQLDELSQS